MATPHRRERDDAALKQHAADNTKVRLENLDLDHELNHEIDSIEKSRIHMRLELENQISEIDQAAKAESLLARLRRRNADASGSGSSSGPGSGSGSEASDALERRKSTVVLATFGKKLRKGIINNLDRIPTSEYEDEDQRRSRIRASMCSPRSETEQPRERERRKSGALSSREREEFFHQLSRPRLTDRYVEAHLYVLNARFRSRASISREDPRREVEEHRRMQRIQQELREILLQDRIIRCQSHSAEVENRIRSFCTEVKSFAKTKS